MPEGTQYRLDIKVTSKVPGGTASTPAIRADGKRVYIADAYGSVYAIDTEDGIYIGNSPLRRVMGRAILGKAHSPQAVVGGITRFKPIHQNLIIRDALWAAINRAKNATTIVNSHP